MVSHQEAKNEKFILWPHPAAFCKFAEPSRTCHEYICETSQKSLYNDQSNNNDGRLVTKQKLLRIEFFFYFKQKNELFLEQKNICTFFKE